VALPSTPLKSPIVLKATTAAPAQHVVEIEFQKFQEGFGWDKSKYQGPPSPELDAAWSDLYTGIIYSRIPKAQAALLPNKTSAIPGDAGHYIIMLNVFHELHCLVSKYSLLHIMPSTHAYGQNMIRKKMHPEYYDGNDTELKNFLADNHIDHCIDSIRASLMCSADISPMVWQWWEPSSRFSPRNDIVHTCRKWDNIHRWAEEHAVLGPIDYSVRIEDDIIIDPF
jgi:hypothetical protein